MKTNKVGESTKKQAGNRGRGRPKGSKNKFTMLLKDDILAAADEAHPEGRVGYLKEQAQENPTAFLTLLGKVLPLDVNAKVTGQLIVATGVPRDDN